MREDTGPRPSAHAAERLAADVGAEVADLRGALRRALDEADRLQAVGRTDLAAELLEDQREALAAVHQHLSDRLAAAAVEREAEHIVDAAARPVRLDTIEARTPPMWDTTVVRLAASAAAAFAGLALLLAPDLGPGMLEAAGFGGGGDTASVERSTDGAPPSNEPLLPGGPARTGPSTAASATDQGSPQVAVTDLWGPGEGSGASNELAPVPQPSPAGLHDLVGGVENRVLPPLVEGIRTAVAAHDETAGSASDEAADNAPWADVELEGSSAE